MRAKMLSDDFADAADFESFTPEERVNTLFDAINLDDSDVVQQLIAAGVSVDARNEYGDTPLILAVHRGHYELAKDLLDLGADPNAKNTDGLTPLHYGARQNAMMTELLLEKGAACPHETNPALAARLPDAIMAGYDRVVEAALTAGANPDILIPNTDNATALHIAAQNAKPAMVKALIKAGADINAIDKNQRSALRAGMESGNEECVMALLDAGADTMNRSMDRSSGRDVTDHSFAINCDFDIAVAVRKASRKFELIERAAEGKADEVRELLADGVELNAVNRQGRTALYQACDNGHADVVQALLEHGADARQRMKNGSPTLAAAVNGNEPECIRLLCEAGASVLEKDGSGVSAADYVRNLTNEVNPGTREMVEHYCSIEVEKLAQQATQLETSVAPLRKLRFQPRTATV
jgi:ankyrin repeat protein